MEYKGYHIGETSEGYKIYRTREAWIDGEEPLHNTSTAQEAQIWVDQEIEGKFERVPPGTDIAEFIKTLPFMPEQGQPLPDYVVRELYPSPIWDLMKSPVSEYGRQVVEETAKRLKDFITGGNFTVVDKFSEEGWSSEDVVYLGDLFHPATSTTYLAHIDTFFEWREPSKISAIVISLWKKDRSEEDDAMWDGELNLEEGKIADKMLQEL